MSLVIRPFSERMPLNCSLAIGKAQGYEVVRTENHAHHDSMLGINVRLGFVRQPAIVTYRKTVVGD
jgi:hypothetical protein